MTNPEQDNKTAEECFEQAARRHLRDGAGGLDAATLSRLNQARQRALAEFDRGRQRPAWSVGWQPALGVVAVAALAIALWVGRDPALTPAPADTPAVATGNADPALDLELLLADDNLELIEELEFYDWLEQAGDTEDGLDPGLSG